MQPSRLAGRMPSFLLVVMEAYHLGRSPVASTFMGAWALSEYSHACAKLL